MSSQNIPLKAHTDFRESSRILATATISRAALARCSSGLIAGPKQAVLRGVGHEAASLPFCGRVRGVRPQRPAHLAVWLPAPHMMVSQGDPTREHDASGDSPDHWREQRNRP
jgi:hypothetical protein